jgi:hypothetical protein
LGGKKTKRTWSLWASIAPVKVARRIRNQLFCVCRFLSDCVCPPSISPVGVDRIDPLLSCLRLYLGSFVVAFHFEDEVRRRLGLESDDKVGT